MPTITPTPQHILWIFLIFLTAKTMIDFYLEWRNKIHIQKHRHQVPEKFASQITLEAHQKAADYSIAKINASFIFDTIEIFLLLIWTLGGGLNALEKFVSSFQLAPITHGLALIGAFALINMILGLPQSLYSTFIIEEKFGFNKVTPKLFITDTLKSIALGVVIAAPILFGILWFIESSSYWWLTSWVFLTTIQIVLLLLYPTLIAPLFNKFTPLEDGPIKDEVVGLLKEVNFSHEELFVMDASKRSSHGNAYFTGFGKKKRIVLFDTLLKNITPEEVRAILAHELGHFKKRHVLKMMIQAMAMSLLGFFIIGSLYQSPIFFQGHGVENVGNAMALILFMMISGIYTFPMTPLNSWRSRKQEFEADAFAAQYSPAQHLISGLIKLYKENASTLTPDPLFSAYYHSHPPAFIRVAHLEQLDHHKQ